MNHVVPLLIAVPNPGQLSAISVVPMYTAQDAFCKSNGFTYVLQDAVGVANGSTILDTLDDVSRQWIILNNTHSGGGAGITTLTSTASTVQVTNPGGPITNIDVQVAADEVVFGSAGNLATFSANFKYFAATHKLQVIGTGTLGEPALVIDGPNATNPSVTFRVAATDQITDFYFGGASFPGVISQMVNVSASGSWSWVDSTFAKTALAIYPNATAFGGDVAAGSGSNLANNATSGFLYVPSIASAPTQVPANVATFVQQVPMVVQLDGTRVWFYIRGAVNAWKSAVLV